MPMLKKPMDMVASSQRGNGYTLTETDGADFL